jgi:hypothetical protein
MSDDLADVTIDSFLTRGETDYLVKNIDADEPGGYTILKLELQ